MLKHLSQETKLPSSIKLDQITQFAASAVILNSKKEILLLLRDDYPLWVNIGGNLDSGETFEQALHREVKEETNSTIIIINKESGDYFSIIDSNKPEKYRHEKVYLCKFKDEKKPVTLGNEGVCLEWFKQDNLPPNILPKYLIRILETVKNIKDKTSILTIPRMKDFIITLKSDQIYGLKEWMSHPRVLKKKNEDLLSFWPVI